MSTTHPKESISTLLHNGNTIFLDGGLATALESLGHDLNHALWSAKLLREDPAAIREVHRDYFLAGADVAITASYQAAIAGLTNHLDLDNGKAREVIRRSVELAIEARDGVLRAHPGRTLFVAGSVGPYGAYLANGAEYTGDYGDVTESHFRDFHRGRIEEVLAAGADVLACETMPHLGEIEALCALLRDEFPESRAWVSCTLKDARHISDGTSVEQVVRLVEQCEQVVAVGFNCVPLDLAAEALEHLGSLTTKPLVIYPNSGERWDGAKKEWYGGAAASERLSGLACQWQASGARLIGGCCRMGYEDVSRIRASVHSSSQSK
ncbi:hypothetical protein ANO11243_089420 [Dothideomycetidae sp. 11243]|nr:hypothetical protein ANO11243_089420 [fungal sp. No.11243]